MIILNRDIYLFIFPILLQSVVSLYILKKMMCLKIKHYCLLFFILGHPFFVMHAVFLLKTPNILLILCELMCYMLFWWTIVDKHIGVSLFYVVFTLSLTFYVKEFVSSFILNGILSSQKTSINTMIGYISVIPIYYLIVKYKKIIPGYYIICEQLVEKYQTEAVLADRVQTQECDMVKVQYRLIIICNIVMLCCYSYSNYIGFMLEERNVHFGCTLIICILLFILTIFMMCVKYREWEVQELMNYKNDLVSGLAIYTKEVEGASESARAFYHDFTNILLSMQETISTKEVGEIRKMYAEILKKCHIGFMARRQEVGKLSHIKVLEVKSVIAAKILRAERHRISIELEIPQVITHLQVDNVDVVRLLGIMLDNAIDEVQALGSAQPVVRLAIFDKDNSRYFVVENEMRQEKLPTHLIFERGYSTKGCTRGYGLANLEKIVASYPWVSYHIQAKNYKYRIELEMRRS